ncbi:MAG TPA: hypothetical protein PLO37_14315 [Candidatus Hydrogenedentes bacterium]|nr:hypothetical protein [Candidatus Hydrogenedentota bacterium]HPG68020.1 hypothetical protein [Candidatus Hydrogenedentota bacterium]
MRTRLCLLIAVVFALMLTVQPAIAWGPRATLALVTSALRITAREARVPLDKLDSDILNGAGTSTSEILRIYPQYKDDPVGAITAELHLLQEVRGPKISPYFAYRLGLIGKMIAEVTSPMAQRSSVYRDLYHADVDQSIDNVALKPAKRVVVDPADYFVRVRREANLRGEVYEKDYKEGIQFAGLAKASLSDDASRSVAAISDVWYTILTGEVLHADRSEAAVSGYVVAALRYYVQYGKEGQLEGSYDELLSLTKATPELHRHLGDMFFDAGKYELAMKEYEAVLAADPGDREIARKAGDYYVGVGDKALNEERLEDALNAFTKALAADALHPDAERKRLEAQRLLAEREERLKAAEAALAAGEEIFKEAEQAKAKLNFANAIALYQQAEAEYSRVPQEFAPQFKKAETLLKEVAYQREEVKRALVNDSQSLSGSGFSLDLGGLTTKALPNLDEEALRTLVGDQLKLRMNRLRGDLEGAFEI